MPGSNQAENPIKEKTTEKVSQEGKSEPERSKSSETCAPPVQTQHSELLISSKAELAISSTTRQTVSQEQDNANVDQDTNHEDPQDSDVGRVAKTTTQVAPTASDCATPCDKATLDDFWALNRSVARENR